MAVFNAPPQPGVTQFSQPYNMAPQYQQPRYGGVPVQDGMMNYASQTGLSIVPMTDDNQPSGYPVAAGNTVAFINFNSGRLCFKSTNVNGVPMPPQWATFVYDSQPQIQNQQPQSAVSRSEFEELKSMMAQMMSMTQGLQQHKGRNDFRQRKGNGGDRDVQHGSDATTNGEQTTVR